MAKEPTDEELPLEGELEESADVALPDGGGAAAARWHAFEEDEDASAIDGPLPVLPLRGTTVFPSAVVPLLVSRLSSLKLVEDALAASRLIALCAQRDATVDEPGPDHLHTIGTAARILKMLKYPDGSVRILVQGIRRIEVAGYVETSPYLTATVREVADGGTEGMAVQALRSQVVHGFTRFVELATYLPEELQLVVVNVKQPGRVADLVASTLNVALEHKQRLIETLDVGDRLRQVDALLAREIELVELGQKIHGDVQSEIGRNQKEVFLREQLKAIRRELGEDEGRPGEIDLLRERIERAKLPDEARKAADEELDRLAVIPPESAEHSVIRTYLEWLADLPWSVKTEDNLDIEHARAILDEDHFGLEKIKDRILEFLAVRKLRANPRGPILCLVGPPGVGKTSLGRSIARALGRKFHRLSLGGVRDEAEIRGHRRTYVGSLPGRIVQGMKAAGSKNPLFMLDEIDKVGADFRGDPASALLEVLDPEQNKEFRDHYIDIPYDLSSVLFLTTANVLDPVPDPLQDRMEVLELAGYSEEEKVLIAQRFLVPRQTTENGLPDGFLTLTDDAVTRIARDYTREAGLRNLEREIGSICRKLARGIAEGRETPVRLDDGDVAAYLGPPHYFEELAERAQRPGVAVGLAWTPQGGDILFIEAARMDGKKQLTLTGQLGEVMKESAQAALTFLRSNASRYGIEPAFFESADIHVHVPAGAIPKDGPSAGVTMTAALASVLTGRALREGVAMSGEITLRGAVLPVGGIKEKVLAARRAGIRELYLPAQNRTDVEDIAPDLLAGIEFHYIHTVDELLDRALAAEVRDSTTRVA